jgi:hypothetical protein
VRPVIVAGMTWLETDSLLPTLTAMDTDKIKVFGARVRVDGTSKLAELERAEKVRLPLFYIAQYAPLAC